MAGLMVVCLVRTRPKRADEDVGKGRVRLKVSVIGSSLNPRAHDGMHTIRAWLLAQGIEVELVEGIFSSGSQDDEKMLDEERAKVAGSHLVVSCGGDGTTLRSARLVGYDEIPIVSLNYGHLGFLASSDEDGVIDKLTTALSGELQPIRRATIAADVVYADGETASYFALNEVVLARGDSGRIVEFSLGVNGQHIANMRGDGIVIATATGSTAYALSAGGPIVSPAYQGLCAVPIAPHTLTARPLLTGPADAIEVDHISTPFAEANLFVDGCKPSASLPEHMTVRRGPGDVLLFQFGAGDFYRMVSRTFYRGDSQCYPD